MVPKSLSAVLITRPSFVELVGDGSVVDGASDGVDFAELVLSADGSSDAGSALPHPATTVVVATTWPTIARMVTAKHDGVRGSGPSPLS
jgi:hypothetical protein